MSAGETRADLAEARYRAARGDLTPALELVDELLRAEPDNAGALVLRSSLLVSLRRELEAIECSSAAVAAAPSTAETWNGLARALHAAGRDPEALEAAVRAESLLSDPANARFGSAVYLTLVWIHRELRQFREAVSWAEKGLQRSPDAVLAQWASEVQQEWEKAEQEEC